MTKAQAKRYTTTQLQAKVAILQEFSTADEWPLAKQRRIRNDIDIITSELLSRSLIGGVVLETAVTTRPNWQRPGYEKSFAKVVLPSITDGF